MLVSFSTNVKTAEKFCVQKKAIVVCIAPMVAGLARPFKSQEEVAARNPPALLRTELIYFCLVESTIEVRYQT
ncbi:hypothetical protein GCM10011318_00510 [Phaeocystidibacter marisrubri]|nr:hypothetical protein GCM10011318_00510 [Phaeocystidibacter marisrubri]